MALARSAVPEIEWASPQPCLLFYLFQQVEIRHHRPLQSEPRPRPLVPIPESYHAFMAIAWSTSASLDVQ